MAEPESRAPSCSPSLTLTLPSALLLLCPLHALSLSIAFLSIYLSPPHHHYRPTQAVLFVWLGHVRSCARAAEANSAVAHSSIETVRWHLLLHLSGFGCHVSAVFEQFGINASPVKYQSVSQWLLYFPWPVCDTPL